VSKKIPPISQRGKKVGVTVVASSAPPALPLPSNYEVITTTNEDQVWDSGSDQTKNVSIMVIDVDLPGFGLDFVRNLHKVFPNMKFIGLTNSASKYLDMGKIAPKGTVTPMMKPVKPDVLAATIKRLAQPPAKTHSAKGATKNGKGNKGQKGHKGQKG
jgi:DNA-binding NtrC family response regulator